MSLENLRQRINELVDELENTDISFSDIINSAKKDYQNDENINNACNLAQEIYELQIYYIEKLEEFIRMNNNS